MKISNYNDSFETFIFSWCHSIQYSDVIINSLRKIKLLNGQVKHENPYVYHAVAMEMSLPPYKAEVLITLAV